MPTSAIENNAGQNRDNLRLPILLFCCLQALDLSSTLLVFSFGGDELNPIVGSLMPWIGRFAAVVASKAALVLIVWTFGRSRKRFLYFADMFYAGVVVWNLCVLA